MKGQIMRIPMPSPKNTNFARLFLDQPGAAYDEALEKDAAAQLHAFLKDRLNPEDLARFCELAGIDAGQAADEDDGGPQPIKGLPEPGGTKFGQDSARSRVSRMRALAARIRVNA
jgi:hypothetical protein